MKILSALRIYTNIRNPINISNANFMIVKMQYITKTYNIGM